MSRTSIALWLGDTSSVALLVRNQAGEGGIGPESESRSLYRHEFLIGSELWRCYNVKALTKLTCVN